MPASSADATVTLTAKAADASASLRRSRRCAGRNAPESDTATPRCLIGHLTPISPYTGRAMHKAATLSPRLKFSAVSPDQHPICLLRGAYCGVAPAGGNPQRPVSGDPNLSLAAGVDQS